MPSARRLILAVLVLLLLLYYIIHDDDAAAIRTCKEQPYGVMCGEEGSILSKKKSADRERTPR